MFAYFSFICVYFYDDVSGLSALSSIKLIEIRHWRNKQEQFRGGRLALLAIA